MSFTIEDLRKGKCAVFNEGDVELLREVLMAAFPEDPISKTVQGLYKFYFSTSENAWKCDETTHLPFQSASKFLEQHDFVLPNKWAVRRDKRTAVEINEYLNSTIPESSYSHVPSGEEDYDYIHSHPVGKYQGTNRTLPGSKESSLASGFTVISFENFKNHVMKKEYGNFVSPRFPFKLMFEQARKILDIACASWKKRLANKWGEELVLYGFVMINEDFYKQMRRDCTKEQHSLFDEIFGKDTLPCPYKDGQLLLVRGSSSGVWSIRYSNGQLNEEGEALCYSIQKKDGDLSSWQYHLPMPEGFTLPNE